MPDIQIVSPFYDEDAKKLFKLCPTKVFDIEDLGSSKKNQKEKKIFQVCLEFNFFKIVFYYIANRIVFQ